jgi:hypothetical protein
MGQAGGGENRSRSTRGCRPGGAVIEAGAAMVVIIVMMAIVTTRAVAADGTTFHIDIVEG